MIVAWRLTLSISLTFATILIGAVLVVALGPSGIRYWFETPAMWALTLLIYADAMRSVLMPTYQLTLRKVVELVAITGIVIALTLIVSFVLFLVVALLHPKGALGALPLIAVNVVLTLVSTRLAFACFALKDHTILGACLNSWDLSSRPTFLPTLLFMATYDGFWFITNGTIDALRGDIQPILWVVLSSVVRFSLVLLFGGFFWVLFAEWMLKCERLHTARTLHLDTPA